MYLMATVWGRIEAWDKWLFVQMNSRWTNPVFDTLFPFFRNPYLWVPLYLFVLVFMAVNFGVKGLWWCLAFLCTVALTDMIGARVFKEGFQRIRPCHDAELANHVRLLLNHCSDSFSFVSNHAANHFGIATFAFLTFRGIFRKWMYLAFFWAFIIAYAQVYVGIHYPLDVVGGALLGVAVGNLTASLFHRKWGNFNLDAQLS